MIKRLWRVIPDGFRRNTIYVIVTIFVRALLNLIGIATLLPVLLLIVNNGDISSSSYLNKVYNLLGCNSYSEFVVVVCVAVVLIIAVKNIVSLVLYRCERNYIFGLYKYLSERLYRVYFERGYGFIKQSNSATLTRNVNAVSMMFVAGVLKPIAAIISEGLLLLLIAVAFFIYSPAAALIVVVVFAPMVALFYLFMRRRLNEIGESENGAQRIKNRIVAETFRGYVDVKMADAFDQMLRRFRTSMDEIVSLRKRHSTYSMLPQIFTEMGLIVGLVTLVLLSRDSSGDDIALLFGVFAVAAVRLIPSVRSMMSSWSSIRFNSYTIDTLCDIEGNNGAYVESDSSLHFSDALELRDVSFKFDDSEKPTLQHLSLRVNKGECLGIRGASGVGKSTLFNLISGIYRPTDGGIYVDGVQLTNANIRAWQKQIGYVSQSVFIADMTLAENIALGDVDNIDYNRVNEVIEIANLKQFVDSLPEGLNTRIGEQGSKISGGQRQRIGIARALYKSVSLLLFDEATSSLDSSTEESINNAIKGLSMADKTLTIVVIAHRDSSLEYCNRIITLE